MNYITNLHKSQVLCYYNIVHWKNLIFHRKIGIYCAGVVELADTTALEAVGATLESSNLSPSTKNYFSFLRLPWNARCTSRSSLLVRCV